ncbi:MAG TPA: IS66 family transposase [Ktedonobacteraceae bacterium]|jgi:transposase
MTAEEERILLRERNREREEHVKHIPVLQEVIKQLTEQVKEQQERVAKTSQKSSLPPSSDRFVRQKKARNLRRQSGKKPGGQRGHQGHRLQMRAEPTEVLPLAPVTRCQHCQADVNEIAAVSIEARQVIDVPAPQPLLVSQDESQWKRCPHCQGSTSALFPEDVSAPVQYGPRRASLAVSVLTQQLLPRRRTRDMLSDLLGVSMSEGTLTTLIKRAARILIPVEEQIKAALRRTQVIHPEESGLSVCSRRIWMHVTSTRHVMHYQVHRSRGHQAIDDDGLLPHVQGTSVHDAWAASFRYKCQHSLCCVHLLRELRFLSQEMGLWWAVKMERVLLAMTRATRGAWNGPRQRSPPGARFLALLDEGDRVHPHIPTPKGKRGRAKQHPARNLLDRLRTPQDAVLAFLSDLDVPFENNLAERDLRMINVQPKVSGTFRSDEGATGFARIRGYLSTLRKQGRPLFPALEATLRGQPVLPSF